MREIPLVWELEAWSAAGLQLDRDYAILELEPEMWKAGIAREAFLGLSAVPDTTDCRILQFDIKAGTLTADAFSTFCTERGLIDSTANELSASRFLEYSHGRLLAWVHIPCNAAALDIAASINTVLAKQGLFLREPLTNAVVFDREGRAVLGPTEHCAERIMENRIAKTT